ncbi:alpha/beta fold hydrolase [uncultured Corynebacterium sp.]|uniref:alpha/beta fold hydrolase n=1 Tax=uncultured Corynebacterium sp. TaxID=159447 RepID=UPI002591F25C|nr:alpha/beta hydrolase [uncultured Corynebacterium sp.]
MTWIILPGLGCPPQDYFELQQSLDAWVMDAWKVGLDAPIAEVRAYARREGVQLPVKILGHSMGGLLALEWAARYPGEVTEILLADATTPEHAHLTSTWPLPKPLAKRVEKLWARLGTDYGVRLPSWVLVPFLPLLRHAMNRWGTQHPEPLSKQERAQYFGSRAAAQSLIRQNCACEKVQRRVFAALGGADSGGSDTQWLRGPHRPKITQLVAAEEQSADTASTLVREQLQLAQRLGARPVFLPQHNHLFPISAPGSVTRHLPEASTDS